MTAAVIISICVLLLIAYVFDITSSKTKVPSVILLLGLGIGVKQAVVFFGIEIPELTPVLPLLGTIGLILIVLEGSLELELDKSRLPIIGKSLVVAIFPMVLLALGLAYVLSYFGYCSLKIGLANAIPLAVISSAVAIPSMKNFLHLDREFVTYESSLSDIIGIVFFNFIVMNELINKASLVHFFSQLGITLLISIVATVALALLLKNIRHHVKFVPIIVLMMLIYQIAESFHLPSLIMILMFGLVVGNIDKLKNIKLIKKLHPEVLLTEVTKFKELTGEMAFLIRTMFFLLFGYLIKLEELFNLETLVWSIGIVVVIYLLRALYLFIMRLPMQPLLFVAPRGLITILLFLSIPISQQIEVVNSSLIIQVIIITSLLMILMKKNEKPIEEVVAEESELLEIAEELPSDLLDK